MKRPGSKPIFSFILAIVCAAVFIFTQEGIKSPSLPRSSSHNSQSSRVPASKKRLDERDFKDHREQSLLLWIRLDYQLKNAQRDFHIESHVVASPPLKLPRTGSNAFPIVDENGKLIADLEIENSHLVAEPFLLSAGEKMPPVSLEDGKQHTYFLRIPIANNLSLFKQVLALGQEKSARAQKSLAARLRRLEEIYILPALSEVAETENKNESTPQELSLIRTNVKKIVEDYFENSSNLARIQTEAAAAKTKISAQKDHVSNRSSSASEKNRAVASVPPQFTQATVRALQIADDNGVPSTSRTSNRLKLIILGDGFQAAEMETFFSAAQAKLNYLMGGDGEAGVSPLPQYRALFDANAIFVPSNASGACHPENGTPCPDTIFGVSFDLYNIARLLSIGSSGYSAFDFIVRTYAPDYDLSLIITNDNTYGGAGGQPALASLNAASNEVIAHELFGHSFSHLGDEYSDPYPGFPLTEEPNTTVNGDAATVKWAQWEQLDTASLNPGNPDLVVKAPVLGAHYHPDGWYRPAINCKMKTLGVPFCPICSEAVIRAIYTKIKPIDSVSPAAGDVEMAAGNWRLNVLTAPVESDLEIQWTINGQSLDLTAATFTPDSLSAALAQYPGIASKGAPYIIQAIVSDNTPLVTSLGRKANVVPGSSPTANDNLLQDSVSWNLK